MNEIASEALQQNIEKLGFHVQRNYFDASELNVLTNIVERFHQAWIQDNQAFYHQRAINSAHLTAAKYLNESERLILFQFIGSEKVNRIAQQIMSQGYAFMNTQLFFNPVNADQPNYWHRDGQYHLNLEQQQGSLQGPEVYHLRIPLFAEPGIELVPGTHRRWDTPHELAVRLQQKGHCNYEPLPDAQALPLGRGDLLIFNGNLIHRGLYGMNRMALDILFCHPCPELLQFVDDDCLPPQSLINKLENPAAFIATQRARNGLLINRHGV
ncbi:phytanoyl-CoA dioxygenase family protein [Alteromonas flava]|uniref:phytanoyl-CoA dioxygenase family protein n=1 Tax=Alteromonas flava TaxID=2048003 RepID=UPI000C28E39A|nr:phytanoyl-CoA dioxygenase family protein [Alteromonas flava]